MLLMVLIRDVDWGLIGESEDWGLITLLLVLFEQASQPAQCKDFPNKHEIRLAESPG